MSKIIQIKGKSYKIIELLGKGAFGQVFKVQCEHEFLALKVEEIQNNVTETGLLKEKKVAIICFQIIAHTLLIHDGSRFMTC